MSSEKSLCKCRALTRPSLLRDSAKMTGTPDSRAAVMMPRTIGPASRGHLLDVGSHDDGDGALSYAPQLDGLQHLPAARNMHLPSTSTLRKALSQAKLATDSGTLEYKATKGRTHKARQGFRRLVTAGAQAISLAAVTRKHNTAHSIVVGTAFAN